MSLSTLLSTGLSQDKLLTATQYLKKSNPRITASKHITRVFYLTTGLFSSIGIQYYWYSKLFPERNVNKRYIKTDPGTFTGCLSTGDILLSRMEYFSNFYKRQYKKNQAV